MLEEMDLDAILARRPTVVLVDELAHTNSPGGRYAKRYQDVEELLPPASTSFRPERPAPRECLRPGRADHHGAGARDLARPCDRQGGRGRADRPHARGPDPAPERGQGLCAGSRTARAQPLFLRRQPDRPARAGAAPHRAAGRRPDADLHAGPRHPGPMGGGRAHPRTPSTSIRARPASSAMRGAPRRTGCRRAGSRSISRRRAITSCRKGRRITWRRPCAWRNGWARRR